MKIFTFLHDVNVKWLSASFYLILPRGNDLNPFDWRQCNIFLKVQQLAAGVSAEFQTCRSHRCEIRASSCARPHSHLQLFSHRTAKTSRALTELKGERRGKTRPPRRRRPPPSTAALAGRRQRGRRDAGAWLVSGTLRRANRPLGHWCQKYFILKFKQEVWHILFDRVFFSCFTPSEGF